MLLEKQDVIAFFANLLHIIGINCNVLCKDSIAPKSESMSNQKVHSKRKLRLIERILDSVPEVTNLVHLKGEPIAIFFSKIEGKVQQGRKKV